MILFRPVFVHPQPPRREVRWTKEKDYAAFEGLLEEIQESRRMRTCAYCLMPNHWHFVLWPEHDGALAAFMQHPRGWRTLVNEPQSEAEVEAIRRCVARGQP